MSTAIRMTVLQILTLLFSVSALAQRETEISFDDIVDGLSKSRSSQGLRSNLDDPFEDVQIHLGLGFASGIFTIQHPGGEQIQANQRGFLINLGIDLFNPNLIAEGGIMSYMEREYDKTSIGLQEFNLKLIYKDFFEENLGYRLGGGLAARYLKIKEGEVERNHSTPSWLVVTGLDFHFSKSLSLGGEVAGRGSLTYETPDQSSMDFSLRLDAHF